MIVDHTTSQLGYKQARNQIRGRAAHDVSQRKSVLVYKTL